MLFSFEHKKFSFSDQIFVCLFVRSLIRLFACILLALCLYICCSFVCLFACLSIYVLFLCLFVCLSVFCLLTTFSTVKYIYLQILRQRVYRNLWRHHWTNTRNSGNSQCYILHRTRHSTNWCRLHSPGKPWGRTDNHIQRWRTFQEHYHQHN